MIILNEVIAETENEIMNMYKYITNKDDIEVFIYQPDGIIELSYGGKNEVISFSGTVKSIKNLVEVARDLFENNYKNNYFNFFEYVGDEYIPCEVCTSPINDIHHIIYRSQGGGNEIDNLIGLCRSCHNRAHFKGKPYLMAQDLQKIHNLFIKRYKELKLAREYS